MGDVRPVPGGGGAASLLGCMYGVVCVVFCVFLFLRAGGVLFKTRTQYRGVLGKTMVFMIFQCSHTRWGRREEGTRGSKRESKQYTKTHIQQSKNTILEGPGPSIKKTSPKPRKSDPREAKMTPRSGPGGPGSGPGEPGSGPRDPKTAPRAPQEPPRSGLRAALVATWGPPGAQEAPGGLREAF